MNEKRTPEEVITRLTNDRRLFMEALTRISNGKHDPRTIARQALAEWTMQEAIHAKAEVIT